MADPAPNLSPFCNCKEPGLGKIAYMSGRGSTGNVIAAVCSIFIPGLGQLVQGRFWRAAFHFVVIGGIFYLLSFLVPVFWIAHLWSMYEAATWEGPKS